VISAAKRQFDLEIIAAKIVETHITKNGAKIIAKNGIRNLENGFLKIKRKENSHLKRANLEIEKTI
jgi:hypothetical protein